MSWSRGKRYIEGEARVEAPELADLAEPDTI
jgi:hypothetical protein